MHLLADSTGWNPFPPTQHVSGVQLALNVSNLDDAVVFCTKLFDTELAVTVQRFELRAWMFDLSGRVVQGPGSAGIKGSPCNSPTMASRTLTSFLRIGLAFVALAVYLGLQSTVVLAMGYHPHHSIVGITWTATTAAVMFTPAAGKARTGAALHNPALLTEGKVTMIDGILATAVLIGLTCNAALGWWWADPAAGYVVVVYYGVREARAALTE